MKYVREFLVAERDRIRDMVNQDAKWIAYWIGEGKEVPDLENTEARMRYRLKLEAEITQALHAIVNYVPR